ncbi:MAG: hypothetical protein IT172_10155 [Acidobacteria bacterium]|nr:hypothetical protein [Acidobacteriota bacterium]
MNLSKKLLVAAISIFLSNIALTIVFSGSASAQTSDLHIALQRGYRTGYSDGYMAGYRDIIDNLSKSIDRHEEYKKADRAFNKDYGTLEEYRDGYQQGFEAGYDTGFEKRSFEQALPTGLKRRAVPTATVPLNNVAVTSQQASPVDNSTVAAATVQPSYITNGDAVIIIPRDTEIMLEMQDDLSTERNREGDKFVAKVVSPVEIAGAVIEGRVAKVTRPGRIKKRSELALSFDRIMLSENRWSNFSAILTEVMPVKGDNVKVVDTEGTAIGKSTVKKDSITVGGATTAGLVTGAIIGGPVGAAVGAGVGAAFGVGAVVIERGKNININRNQQVRIKTSYETQIR